MSALNEIDWTGEATEAVREFLTNHKMAMLHCDEEIGVHGLCECMRRLAEWWATQRLEVERLETALTQIRDGVMAVDEENAGWLPFKLIGILAVCREALGEET